MGRFSGLLICSDFDGTLAQRGAVSQRNIEAIRYFQDRGGLFTLATGRSPRIMQEQTADFSCNASIITMNGTLLYNVASQRVDYECPMDPSYAEVVSRLLLNRQGLRDMVFFPRASYGAIPVDLNDSNTMRAMLREEMYKLVFHVDTEWSDDLKERLTVLAGEKFSVCRSWINGVELHSSLCNKGKTARRLARLVGADQLIGVGDYENDLPLILEADVGYAMGNAVESLKEAADAVLDTVQNDGFAQMIYNL